jgi:hypothetical protein
LGRSVRHAGGLVSGDDQRVPRVAVACPLAQSSAGAWAPGRASRFGYERPDAALCPKGRREGPITENGTAGAAMARTSVNGRSLRLAVPSCLAAIVHGWVAYARALRATSALGLDRQPRDTVRMNLSLSS